MAGRVSSPRFVGRREERAALGSALAHARAGLGSVVLVAAEAGMGKSRLLSEVARDAGRLGMASAVGECLPFAEGELPYAPIAGAVRSLVRRPETGELDALLAPEHQELAALMPELPFSGNRISSATREGSQARLFDQLVALLAGSARTQPLLLIIEDFQWADRSTRDFLEFLVRATRREPIALIVSYRSDELHRRHPLRPFVLELERSGRAVRVDLAPFTRAEMREQVTAILGEVPPPQLVDRLRERSEGNPFFTEELLASSREPDEPLPESLRDTLLARVEAQPAAARDVLRIAAVVGRTVDHARIAALARLAEDELNGALREAVESCLITHDTTRAGYSFRHALLREAIYSDLLPGERSELHLRVARTASRPAELAHHWYAAGELQASLAASVDAGAAAEALYAFSEAGLHYQRALEIWDAVGPDPGELVLERLEVLRRAADAALMTGEADRAIVLANEVLARLDQRATPVQAALAYERLGRYLWTAGRDKDALSAYRRAVELMPDAPPSEERALVLAADGQVLMLCGRTEESSARCEAALAIARAIRAEAVEAHVLNTMCGNLSGAGWFGEAVAAARQALAIAGRLGLATERNRSYMNGSDALDEAGRIEESIALAREGVDSAEEVGIDRQWGDLLRGEIAGRLLQLGRWSEAEQLLEEVIDRAPTGVTARMAYRNRAYLCVERGEFDDAARALDQAEQGLHRSLGSMTLGPPAAVRASLELWAGRPEEAAAVVARCLERVGDRQYLFFTTRVYELGTRACADVAAGTPGDARALERLAATAHGLLGRLDQLIARQAGAVPPLVRASRAAAAAECSGIGHTGDPALWADAASQWDASGNRYHAAYARWQQAEALLAGGGERAAAAPLVRAAHAVAGDLGARPLRERLEGLARRARIDLGERHADATANPTLRAIGLTPRELEVFALLADGLTNRDIGAELFISAKTAGVHVSRILTKLSVPNRAAAAAAAQRLGADRADAQ